MLNHLLGPLLLIASAFILVGIGPKGLESIGRWIGRAVRVLPRWRCGDRVIEADPPGHSDAR